MTGTGEDSIFSMILRVESSNPPGVFISISTAWSWFAAAASKARPRYSTVTGWMTSLTSTFSTSAEQEAARSTETRTPNKKRDATLALRTGNRKLRPKT